MAKHLATTFLLASVVLLLSLPALAGEVGVGNKVPEPATIAMLAMGIGSVAILRRNRAK